MTRDRRARGEPHRRGRLRRRAEGAAADAATARTYLALELVDPSGRIPARVWNDVDLLDGRFEAGDAVRVLGRVEKFRNVLQLEVRTLEPAEGVDPAELAVGAAPRRRRARGLPRVPRRARSHDDGLRAIVARALGEAPLRSYPATPDGHHSYAGGLLEHTVGVATLCRELCQIHPRLRRRPPRSRRRSSTTSAARASSARRPSSRRRRRGKLLGHVHLGLRLLEELDAPAELLHAVACHHDARAARTAEAAVLYHANQLDAVAATRPVPA